MSSELNLPEVMEPFKNLINGAEPYSMEKLEQMVKVLESCHFEDHQKEQLKLELDCRLFPRLIHQLICLDFSHREWQHHQSILRLKLTETVSRLIGIFCDRTSNARTRELCSIVEKVGILGMLWQLEASDINSNSGTLLDPGLVKLPMDLTKKKYREEHRDQTLLLLLLLKRKDMFKLSAISLKLKGSNSVPDSSN